MLTQALLVDDSRSVLDFLKRHIEADGRVQAAAFLDPVEAFACARERDFDIVLVDYEMPGMDGISFIRALRKLPKFIDIPVVMITSIQTDEVKMRALEAGATDFLPKQPQSLETSVRLRNLIRLGVAVRKLNDRAADLASEVAAATRKLQEREEEIILRLALAVEYRDNDTGEHTLRVAQYSRLIAEQLGLPARLCRDIYLAAPLHDVGKVAIPDNILLKPGKLTGAEMDVIRTHATIGERILANSTCELIQLGAQIAAAHHERWDGAGYPRGLKETDIPVAARGRGRRRLRRADDAAALQGADGACGRARLSDPEQGPPVRPRLRRRLPVALGRGHRHRDGTERRALPDGRSAPCAGRRGPAPRPADRLPHLGMMTTYT